MKNKKDISLWKIYLIPFLWVASAHASPVTLSLEEVVRKVSSENYLVLENALRVYQAKESIQVSRGNLLPNLNLWKIAAIPFEPLMALGEISDIAPFLVPANWFRVQEQKILSLATEEAYRALWANEVMTAKALYFKILLDEAILKHLQEIQRQFETILIIAETREQLGGLRQGAAREIEIQILGLQEDMRYLQVLLTEERTMLSYVMGHDLTEDLNLASIEIPDIKTFEPLFYSDFEFRSLDSSPEIRQFEHLISVSAFVKKEVLFSFLGSSMMSRGVEGGVFDMLPLQQGLGFGTMPSLRIVKAQKEILKTQKRGIEETVRRQLKILIHNYNIDLENYDNLQKRVALTQKAIDQLFERLSLGAEVAMNELVDASRDHIEADIAFLSVQYRFLEHEDKLSRLIFHGDYNKKPAVLDRMGKK